MSWSNAMSSVPLPGLLYVADDTVIGTLRTVTGRCHRQTRLRRLTVSLNTISSSEVTLGAVNCRDFTVSPVRSVGAGPESLVHSYVSGSQSGSLAVPDRVTRWKKCRVARRRSNAAKKMRGWKKLGDHHARRARDIIDRLSAG